MSGDLAGKRRTKGVVDWSKLSEGPLVEVGRRIREYEDFVRFGSVCRNWQSAAGSCIDEDLRATPTTPVLLVFCTHNWLRTPRYLYDLTTRRPCGGDMNEILYEPACGSRGISSQGWLVVMKERRLQPLLLNPFDGTTIQLPDFSCARCYGNIRSLRVVQAIISSNPSFTSDYTVMLQAMVRRTDPSSNKGEIFLWRASGGNVQGCDHPGWLKLPPVFNFSAKLACFRGLYVSLDRDGSIRAADASVSKERLMLVGRFPYHHHHQLLSRQERRLRGWREDNYLVETQRGLLVILQWFDTKSLETKGFHLFEFDWATKEWTQVEDLGGRALFLQLLQPPTFIDCNRFVANRIYFVSCYKVAKIEIYNLATKSFESPIEVPPCQGSCLEPRWLFYMKKNKPAA